MTENVRLLFKNETALSYWPSLRLCIPFNFDKSTVFLNNFYEYIERFPTFHSHKIPLLAFLGLLQTDDRFPYSFYTSLCFEQLSTSFSRGSQTLHFATNNHQPLFQGSQREPWERGCRTVWMVNLWFNYVIFRVLSFTFRKDSSRANQLPCQSCCVEVISLGDFSLRPWAGVRQAGLFSYFYFRQFLLSKVSKCACKEKLG